MSARVDVRRRPFSHRLAPVVSVLIACSCGLPAIAQTQDQNQVDLQLALMVDASGSVNQTRFELQRRGYVAALRSPRVLGAILGGSKGSIAITLVQWTGPLLHVPVLPWTLLKDQESILSAAKLVEDTPRQLFGGGTSISGAIDHAMSLFPQSPFKGERRIMDISGDGSNNSGRSVTRARDEAVNADVTINGLPILAFEPNLDQYYRDYVIGGPGAFMIVANDFESFADAILKKMIVEIAENDANASGVVRKRN